MSEQHSLILTDVTKRYGDFVAVDKINVSIPKGSIYGFLGPNGAGKTTTIRMIMSIIYPDEGEISILGQKNAESVKDRLGYLPEEKGLYKKMTAGEILVYFGQLKGLDRKPATKRAHHLLKKYGLGDHYGARCESLSKGMGQKIQILGTIMHEPELVILDEPFSGLDPVNSELMQHLIRDMKDEGNTVIFSTHIMHQAEQLCDYILLVNHGKTVLNGTLSEVKGSGDKGILLDYDGDGSFLKSLPGVARINNSGKQAEMFLDPGTDPQSILAQVVGKLTVRRFDLREPSLHEIFVRAVGGHTDE